MPKKLYNSQIDTIKTYHMKVREMLSLAENVLIFPDMPLSVSKHLLNSSLVKKGSVIFFKDEILSDSLLCAKDYIELEKNDNIDKITKVKVNLANGYHRILTEKEFVIMFDNISRRPIYMDILQYAERLTHSIRTSDININQQKTPRMWKTTEEKKQSLIDAINRIESFEDVITGYEDSEFDENNIILAPAPFVADKVDLHAEKIYNEFLAKIGVASLTVQKKERNIKDEIQASLGGTIANRYSRYTARADALQEIKEKFRF